MKRFRTMISLAIILALCLSSVSVCAQAQTDTATLLEVSLYYPNGDLSGLSRVQTEITIKKGETLTRALIAAFMQEPNTIGVLPLFGQNARIDSIEDSLHVVTLNVNTYVPTEERLRALSSLAVWKVLSEYTQTQGVNILIDSCAASFEGKPLNTMLALKTDALAFEELLTLALKNRAYTVYLPENSGSYVVPVLKEMIPENDDMKALAKYICPAQDEDGFLCIWPEGFDFAEGTSARYSYTSKNRRCLHVSYADPRNASIGISDAFRQCGAAQWQFIASIVLTYCTNLPDTERIKISLMGYEIHSMTDKDGTERNFAEGEIARRSFHSRIAAVLQKLSKNDENEKYSLKTSLMNAQDTASVQNILANCLPEEQSADDILSVTVAGRTANVDLSGECYARYQSISPKQEQQILYAIVNALYLNLAVTGVNFTVEGMQADSFASSINLKTVLHPDFGLLE